MAFQDKKFLDAEGITHLVKLLDEYPNNQILGTVIDTIEGELDQKAEKSEIPNVPVQDVQVDGISALNEGVANVPIATSSVPGVVKVDGRGLAMSSAGVIQVMPANSSKIKIADDNFFFSSVKKQHESAFYGLAKAAGDTTQSQSDNAVGTYTDSAKTAIQTMLDVPSNAAMTTAIGNAIGNINSFDMAVVQALPTEDISTHTIYLVPKTGETNDVYDEYVYINDAWEMVGNTQIDLSNYVQKTDYATANEAGVVYLAADGGLQVVVQRLAIKPATDSQIREGTKSLSPATIAKQHQSVFYGLAKAAGDTTQSQSSNAVGTYTAEAQAAIQNMLDVPAKADIPDLSNYVQKTDYATANVAGVVKIDSSFTGLNMTPSGILTTKTAALDQIKAGASGFQPIQPGFQHASTFYGLAKAAGDTTQSQSDNAVGTYTDEAKAAIQNMLDVPSISDIPIEAGTGDGSVKTKNFSDEQLNYHVSADGKGAFASGGNTSASGAFSHAEGMNTSATGFGAHVEGGSATEASGMFSHAEGWGTTASKPGAHSEGQTTIASGNYSHAEGKNTTASGSNAHAEGYGNTASGNAAHAEGRGNTASGQNAHVEGQGSTGTGMNSHTEGFYTIGHGQNVHVEGMYNVEDNLYPTWVSGTEYHVGDNIINPSNNFPYKCIIANSDIEFTTTNWENIVNNSYYAHIVGNGDFNAPSNAYALDWDGNGHYMGDIYVGANADSTGGTKVATVAELATKLDAAEAGLKVVRLI